MLVQNKGIFFSKKREKTKKIMAEVGKIGGFHAGGRESFMPEAGKVIELRKLHAFGMESWGKL